MTLISKSKPASQVTPIAVYYPGHRAVPPALRAFLDVVREMGREGA